MVQVGARFQGREIDGAVGFVQVGQAGGVRTDEGAPTAGSVFCGGIGSAMARDRLRQERWCHTRRTIKRSPWLPSSFRCHRWQGPLQMRPQSAGLTVTMSVLTGQRSYWPRGHFARTRGQWASPAPTLSGDCCAGRILMMQILRPAEEVARRRVHDPPSLMLQRLALVRHEAASPGCSLAGQPRVSKVSP